MQHGRFPQAIVSDYGAFDNKTTTINTYVDIGVLDCLFHKTKQLGFTATTHDLKLQILGSLDGGLTYPHTAEAEFTLTAGNSVLKTVTGLFTHIKPQVKPAVADTHGTVATQWFETSL